MTFCLLIELSHIFLAEMIFLSYQDCKMMMCMNLSLPADTALPVLM